MLDQDLKLTLIEVNSNPCLETPCPLLGKLIPQAVDQAIKLAVDPFISVGKQQYCDNSVDLAANELRYQLVYEKSINFA
jgi:hypothetical protein